MALTIKTLTDEQLKIAALRMAPGSDGWDAGMTRDWQGVREAMAEAVRDGYAIEDFLG